MWLIRANIACNVIPSKILSFAFFILATTIKYSTRRKSVPPAGTERCYPQKHFHSLNISMPSGIFSSSTILQITYARLRQPSPCSRLRRPEGRIGRQYRSPWRGSSLTLFSSIFDLFHASTAIGKKCLPYDGMRYKNRIHPPHLPAGAKNPRRSSYVIDDASRGLRQRPFFLPHRKENNESSFIQLTHSTAHHCSYRVICIT